MQFLPMAKGPVEIKDKKEQITIGDTVELADINTEVDQEICCGGPPPEQSNPFEKPGYELQHYVRAFVKTNHRDIPLVKTQLQPKDYKGGLLVRLGLKRDNYKVPPGLYGAGNPNENSPVIVTANYKLTFDIVRKEVRDIDCWLLVLDTCGINVWCAAGKGTFSTEEILKRIEATSLSDIIKHRQLIVPQLGATGVAAHEVKLKSGFRIIYGPIQISDLPAFLHADMIAHGKMRDVTFSLWERAKLIPVELFLFIKKIWWVFPIIFLLSGLTTSFYSLQEAWSRGLYASAGISLGTVCGGILVPLLLPWIPGRSFSLKGALVGLVCAGAFIQVKSGLISLEKLSLVFIVAAISSYLAMTFTGSTPFTSPSGVEKEMKKAIPIQAICILVGAICWLVAPFI